MLRSTALLVLACACLPARAEEPAAMPCMASICVGDDLRSLLDRPWRTVAERGTVTAADLGAVAAVFAGPQADLTTIAAYWPARPFDADGLAALARVERVCGDLGVWRRPHARLADAAGHSTTVVFEPVTEASRGLYWRVASIELRAGGAGADGALAAVTAELTERYGPLPAHPTARQPGLLWRPFAVNGPTLTLFAPLVPRGMNRPGTTSCGTP